MMPNISIIVPVYNTASYLVGCIDSILAQSFADFELILVDDGSTDESSAICEEAVVRDSRIRCYHQANQGQQRAVQNGLRLATGSWVFFVDSDDSLPSKALETLFSQVSDATDIIVGFSYQGNGALEEVPINEWRRRMLHGSEILSTRWGKLYRRGLLDEICTSVPAEIRVGEDMIMNIQIAFKTEKPVVIVNKQVYCYNRNATSVSSTYRWTIDRFEKFYDAIQSSIPDDYEQTEEGVAYRRICVKDGFSMIRKVLTFGRRNQCKFLSSSKLLAKLRKDVEETKYKMDFEERLLLNCPSSICLQAFFVLKRKSIIVCQVVKRRISLYW